MINKDLIYKNIFNKSNKHLSTREGFGQGLLSLASIDGKVVALSADLTESTKFHYFANKYPERFIQVGIAEQNMIGVATGLALSGKKVFVSSYAVFSPGRNWDQIRVGACYNNLNINIISSHSGLSVGPDGATHQSLEDLALMRALPNMKVVSPCDYNQAKQMAFEVAKLNCPTYIRLTRPNTPQILKPESGFKIGKAQVLFDAGDDIAIIAHGPLNYESLLAAKELNKLNIKTKVINFHTIKPLDKNLLLQLSKTVKGIVVVEDHQEAGGLFSAISEYLIQIKPIKIKSVSVKDEFGQSGTADELYKYYGLTKNEIIKIAKSFIKNK